MATDVVLPLWLDEFIFGKLVAKYSPDYVRYEYNLDLSKEETRIYLGTYFPRSYAEAIVLFTELYSKTTYFEHIKQFSSLNVMDLGCGSGGEIIGLMSFLENRLPQLRTVNVMAIDGNHEALRLYESVMRAYASQSRLNINYTVGPAFIEKEDDLELIVSIAGNKFDVILSFKAICELVAKKRIVGNAYAYCANMLAANLSNQGIMLLEDVTVLSKVVGMFLPFYMNKGLNDFLRNTSKYKSVLPISCRKHEIDCKAGCFFSKVIQVTHSKKRHDTSKVTYRFIGLSSLADSVIKTDAEDINCKYERN